MRRRTVLAALSGAVGLPGCLGGPRASTTGPSVAEVDLRSALRYLHSDDAIGVESPEHDQFAFVRPPADLEAPGPDAFALELGDRQYEPRTSVPGFSVHMPEVNQVYSDEEPSGWLMFDVPTVQVDDGSLVVESTRYPFEADELERFATAPELDLRSVSVPDEVAPDDPLEVEVSVANDGDARGVFLAGVQRSGLFATLTVPVEPDGRGTDRVWLDVYGNPGGSVHFRLVHAGGLERYSVPIETETNTETATATETDSATGDWSRT